VSDIIEASESESTEAVGPCAITFEILAKDDSKEAGAVLNAALDVATAEIRKRAAAAVILRRSQLSIVDVIRRVETLADDVCDVFSRSPDRFTPALNESLTSPREELRLSAIEFIRRTGNLPRFPSLLEKLQRTDGEFRDRAIDAVRDLARQLARRLMTDDQSILPGLEFDVAKAHQEMLPGLLDKTLDVLEDERHREVIIESILLLGDIDGDVVRNLLELRDEQTREMAGAILRTDKHPAIHELLCQSLQKRFPPPITIEAIASRGDAEFVAHMLHWLPGKRNRLLQNNLEKLEELPWLVLPSNVIRNLPKSTHRSLVNFLDMVRIDPEVKKNIKGWIVRHSDAAGRHAAGEVLLSMPTQEVQKILYEALNETDPDIEAWATRQLRTQKLPDTFQQLIKRLEGDVNGQVKNAARDELSSFNLEKVLDLFEQLPESTRRRCGELLMKIDSETHLSLRRELAHPYRWRRIRAARAAAELGFLGEVMPAVCSLLEDADAMVRRTAIESLATLPTPVSIAAIRARSNDESRMVRQASREALAAISRQVTEVSR
jgi:HEAT repeat protein